jgi:hypothetical protein
LARSYNHLLRVQKGNVGLEPKILLMNFSSSRLSAR